MADDRGRDAGAAVGLRELAVPAQRVDEVAGEVGAVGRGQRRALLALEVLAQHEFLVATGEDKVDARPLEVAVEQQMSIRNNYGVGRRMPPWKDILSDQEITEVWAFISSRRKQ